MWNLPCWDCLDGHSEELNMEWEELDERPLKRRDGNARQDNQQGGGNKPLPANHDKGENDERQGRDEAPKRRPGRKKSPWLGGG
jgi:hypothetical protein